MHEHRVDKRKNTTTHTHVLEVYLLHQNIAANSDSISFYYYVTSM
jgi:hypothetical protein